MKLSIERGALLRSLGHVQSVVERRNTIPVLSNVQIEAVDDRVILTATDLDIAIQESVPARIGVPGATTAPAHTLYDIVRKLPEGADVDLTYNSADQRLTVAAGRSRFALSCLPREDFPAMAETGDLTTRFRIQADALRKLIDKTRFAISTEETRYYLNGIYIHAHSQDGVNMLRAVATDGHRLARFELPLPDGAQGMAGVIIPRKAVNELRKLIDETDGAVDVGLAGERATRIRFGFEDAVLTSKLIDGTFPDYTRVIPVANDKVLGIDTSEFARAVDRVSTISSEKSRAVKLALDRDRVTLSVNSPDNGSATEEVTADYAGPGLEIGFNARYLLDIAGQIEGPKVRLDLADSASPTLVRDLEDESALYVLMPMRV